MKKILIVEDEKTIVDILKFNLIKEGFEISEAYDGLEGLEKALTGEQDLILLDVMLPGMNGFDVCRKIREENISTPIIMLTAREEEKDKVLGLEIGADDYITKPFSLRELVARIKANTRRTELETRPASAGNASVIKKGKLSINLESCEVRRENDVLELTVREFELLKFLASSPEKVFSREELMQKVWNYEYFGDVRTVDVTVRRLREKVEKNPAEPEYIMTKRGMGYYFAMSD